LPSPYFFWYMVFVNCCTEYNFSYSLQGFISWWRREGNENVQEILSKQLYLCQFMVALGVVRTKGGLLQTWGLDTWTKVIDGGKGTLQVVLRIRDIGTDPDRRIRTCDKQTSFFARWALFEATFTSFFNDKKSERSRNLGFSYYSFYFCLMINGSVSGAGSVHGTNESRSGSATLPAGKIDFSREKRIWIFSIPYRF